MKTIDLSQAEMEKHIARFSQLKPNKSDYAAREGISPEAYELVAAKNIYLLMAKSKAAAGANTQPAVEGLPGTSLYIVECPPGNGPALHAHMQTRESFMALTGRWEIRWGDRGEGRTELEPFDLISVPEGVTRAFKNVSDKTAYLMAIIQGEDKAALNDIALTPEVGEEVVRRFGPEAKAGLERIGMSFTAGLAE
jgi:uncharacterized RmlC-like cupin family protein